MAIYENSRYLHTPLISRKGVFVLGIRKRFHFNPENYSVYMWVEGDTLDGVAHKFYGISNLRWAILDANPKYRTEFEIKNGDIINIPKYEEVVDLVNV